METKVPGGRQQLKTSLQAHLQQVKASVITASPITPLTVKPRPAVQDFVQHSLKRKEIMRFIKTKV